MTTTVNVQDERKYQMPPMARAAVGAILRRVLGYGSVYLVARGVWTDEASMMYVAAAAGFLMDWGWSYWQKYSERRKLVTALSMEEPSTETQVEVVVEAGEAPSVNTPKNVVPVPTV